MPRPAFLALLLAAAPAAAQPGVPVAPVSPTVQLPNARPIGRPVVGNGTIAGLPTPDPAIAQLRADLAATRMQMEAMRTTMGQLQQRLSIYEKLGSVLVDRVNQTDKRFAAHRHGYTYIGVDFTTKWFVKSGRPIAKDETYDFGSQITKTPALKGVTTPPEPQ